MSDTELLFAPLGGCREIGMNLNAYAIGPASNRKWLVVDVGVTFGDESTPGVDLIMPDPLFLEGEDIVAIVLTHAHEDHIGAVAHLWPRLRAPVYATPFTAHLVIDKLKEQGLDKEVVVNVVTPGDTRSLGPFEISLLPLTHSIPEMNALAIKTELGVIFHTGDWKIDGDPLVGRDIDIDGVKALGDAGVLAMVCDSTNVFEEGESGSELGVRDALIEAVRAETGRVAITTFASNVARLESACMAAMENDRSVCLVGRSMFRITAAAQAVGMLEGVSFVDMEDANSLPPENIMFLCTGSQGEPRAALSRIARGDHPHVEMGEGDTVFFSSRVIPGNEKGIFELQNDLADRGVKIVTERQTPIHVSGHPCRDELRRMYQWARPQISVPVHGERRHIIEHARFAKSLQVPEAITPTNGDVVKLAPGPAGIVDEAPVGRLYLDGNRLTPANAGGMVERRRLSYAGYIGVSVAIDEKGRAKDGPLVAARGFSETDGRAADESLEVLDEAAEEAFERMSRRDAADDDAVERLLGRAVRRAAEQAFGKRPTVDVTVLRV